MKNELDGTQDSRALDQASQKNCAADLLFQRLLWDSLVVIVSEAQPPKQHKRRSRTLSHPGLREAIAESMPSGPPYARRVSALI